MRLSPPERALGAAIPGPRGFAVRHAGGETAATCPLKPGEARMIPRLMPYLLVGVGSFVGGNARYLLSRWVGGATDLRFPLATFLINVSGSFVLGLVGGLLPQRPVPHADAVRLALGVACR